MWSVNDGVCESMHADVKRGSRRHVEEISEEDYLFSLDVRIFVFLRLDFVAWRVWGT